MRRTRTLVTTALLTLGLVTAVFAGAASAGEELSKKEYLKEGNKICKQANDDVNAIFDEAFAGIDFPESGQPPPEAAGAIEMGIAAAAPVFQAALAEIDALEGPRALEQKVQKLIEQYTAVLEDVVADPQQLLTEEDDPFERLDKRARKLGLKACDDNDEEE